MLALEGIKIVDLSRAAPGPFCTMILGDLGAEVIKVEAPPGASRLRTDTVSEEEKKNVVYQATGRNKKSIALNLQTEAGRRIFYQLAEDADVIMEGFRPGVVARLGVDYKTVSKMNPRIIYCSITSYGQDGPYRDVIAHDINSISMAGALGLIGEKDGRPVIPLNLLADLGGSGMCATIGILSALIAREKTGRGQYVDISMLDTTILLIISMAATYFRTNIPPKRGESTIAGAAPHYSVYETKDGKYLTIGNVEPWIWADFCRLIGKEDFIAYQRDETKWEEVRAYFKQLFLTKTRDEWFDFLSPRSAFVGKVYSVDEVFTDPQVRYRQMLVEKEHPTLGKVKHVGVAIKLSDTPGEVRSLPPVLGEHTEEILLGLGYNKQKIDELRREGAIA